jgi:guanylate kinase
MSSAPKVFRKLKRRLSRKKLDEEEDIQPQIDTEGESIAGDSDEIQKAVEPGDVDDECIEQSNKAVIEYILNAQLEQERISNNREN